MEATLDAFMGVIVKKKYTYYYYVDIKYPWGRQLPLGHTTPLRAHNSP